MTKHTIYSHRNRSITIEGDHFSMDALGNLRIMDEADRPLAGMMMGEWTSFETQSEKAQPPAIPPMEHRYAGMPMFSALRDMYFLLTPATFDQFDTTPRALRMACIIPALSTYWNPDLGFVIGHSLIPPQTSVSPAYNSTDAIQKVTIRGILLKLHDRSSNSTDYFFVPPYPDPTWEVDHRPPDTDVSGARRKFLTLDVVFHADTLNFMGKKSKVLQRILAEKKQTLLCAKIPLLIECNLTTMQAKFSTLTKTIRGNCIISSLDFQISVHAVDLEVMYQNPPKTSFPDPFDEKTEYEATLMRYFKIDNIRTNEVMQPPSKALTPAELKELT